MICFEFDMFSYIQLIISGAALILESSGIEGFWQLGLSIMTLNILLSKHGPFSDGSVMLVKMYCTLVRIMLSEYLIV